MHMLSLLILASAAAGGDLEDSGHCTRGCTRSSLPVRRAHYTSAPTPSRTEEVRVTAVLSEHGVRIVSPRRSKRLGEQPTPADALLVVCDELELDTRTESKDGLWLRCIGDVRVDTKRFTARAGRVLSKGDTLILEADGATKVHVRAKAAAPDQPSLTLSAERVTLDLALNHVTVEQSDPLETVAPVADDATAATAVEP